MSPPSLPAHHRPSVLPGDSSMCDPWSRRSACSPNQLLWVLSYAPAHGKQGAPIAVTFTCKGDLGLGAHIRLVVGRRAVSTSVHELAPAGSGRWQLDALVPPLPTPDAPPLAMLPLTIQALDEDNRILDSVTFGDLTYEEDTAEARSSGGSPPRSALRLVTGVDISDRSSRRTSPYSHPHTPLSSSESDHHPPFRRSASRSISQPNGPGLRRTRQTLELTDQNTQSAVLDIMTPLDTFCYHWDEAELQAGRRLVRFRRVQDRNRLMISAERISQAEHDPSDIVVSCIYREDTDSCCITSVDIIHLLQRLVDAEFEVDEKNRIRRNLEGLRPTTVSKSRAGFEAFFQRIMDFPDPKPRKIEKDLKVFDWKLLPQALEKIISKYSLYTCSFPDSPRTKEDGPAPLPAIDASFHAHATPVSIKDEPLDYFPSELSSATAACHEPQMEVPPPLTRLSPIVQLPFPAEPSADAIRGHPLFSVQDSLSPVFVDPALMKRYLAGGYRTACHPIVFGPDPPQTQGAGEWVGLGQSDDVMLVNGLSLPGSSAFGVGPGQTLTQTPTPAFGFAMPVDAQEVPDLYGPPHYAMNTYDSFEFQTLREHNMNSSLSAALAGQVA